MNAFTIKDLENLSGIKAHTIRIWEQRYCFLKPQRTATNIRYYSNEELKKVLNISLLNKYGYKISHISKMNNDEMKERVLSLTNQEAQQERILNELIQYMVDMEMDKMEKLLNSVIISKGIEKTITQVVFPFLEKIGILWITNHINPAQEHLVSNLIRQKLIVGIEHCMPQYKNSKTAILFLPEGEFHELGLLYAHFLLKSRGVKVLYLGSNVPFRDLHHVLIHKKPDFVYTHLTTTNNSPRFERLIDKFSTETAVIPMIISGQLAQSYNKKVPSRIIFKKSLPEMIQFISSL